MTTTTTTSTSPAPRLTRFAPPDAGELIASLRESAPRVRVRVLDESDVESLVEETVAAMRGLPAHLVECLTGARNGGAVAKAYSKVGTPRSDEVHLVVVDGVLTLRAQRGYAGSDRRVGIGGQALCDEDRDTLRALGWTARGGRWCP